MKKLKLLIFAVLCVGFIYRLALTSNGHFIFNIDNGRDMVDVREMVEIKKFRLTGPTSAIEGVYNGPAWYYFLVVPYLIADGDPYAPIVAEIFLWAIGGYFLLKLVSRYGKIVVIMVGSLWIASNFIVLATQYAFNPNPIIFLTPLLIYSLERYLREHKLLWSLLTWFLAGLFFQFEMAVGIFMPVIIILSVLFLGNKRQLWSWNFLLGVGIFILTLLPQIIFDLKHQFIMSNSLIKYLTESSGKMIINPISRLAILIDTFYKVLLPTFMNLKLFTLLSILLYILTLRSIKKDSLFMISSLFILVPLIGFLIIPTNVSVWHLNGVAVAAIIISGILVSKLRILAVFVVIFILVSSLTNMSKHLKMLENPYGDASLLATEIAAVDWVYKYANGQNFKVYTYQPSVYDYPYQYLFWWHGTKKYGYIPVDYAYLPNKPQYIPSKDKFDGDKTKSAQFVFLIKEPDRIQMRQAWENDFKDLKLISKQEIGPLEIEVREE